MDALLSKIALLKEKAGVDLSTAEDLSVAVMNLISLEEHFFFTAEKTKQNDYFDLMHEVRELRKKLLARMIDSHEGETWCVAKHLLAASMRLIEVGTKLQGDGKKDDAKEMFDASYRLYTMFWMLRLKLVDIPNAATDKKTTATHDQERTVAAWSKEDILSKLVDCCKE